MNKYLSHLTLPEKISFFLLNLEANYSFRRKSKKDIINKNPAKLVQHINAYESYPIPNYNYDKIAQLKFYANSNLVVERIFKEYLLDKIILDETGDLLL